MAITHIQVMYETHIIFLRHTLWKRNRKQFSIARAQSSGGEGERWRRMNWRSGQKGMVSQRKDSGFSPKGPLLQRNGMSIYTLRKIILAAVWRAEGRGTEMDTAGLIRKLLHFSR